jgi:membrane protease YdiL (CAAX protease family)
MFLFYVVLTALMYQLTGKYPRFPFKDVIAWHSNRQPLLKLVVIPAVLGLGMAGLLSLLVVNRNAPSTPMSAVLDTTSSSGILLAFLAMVFLMGPLMEEIAFRGFYYYVIRKVVGPVFAFSFIVFVFAILHVEQYWGDGLAIFIVALLGVMLTACRVWTGSCIASTVMHACYNGAMVIVPAVIFSMTYPHYFEYQMRYHELDTVAKKELLLNSARQHPHHADTYFELARLYGQEQRDWEEALRYIDKALSYDERRYMYLDQKAEVLFQMGRGDDAITIEEEIVRRFPAKKYQARLRRFKDVGEEAVAQGTSQ